MTLADIVALGSKTDPDADVIRAYGLKQLREAEEALTEIIWGEYIENHRLSRGVMVGNA